MTLSKELRKVSDPAYAKKVLRFFKTGKGDYAEGDIFLGVRIPEIRKLAKKNIDSKKTQINKLMRSKIHEERLLALLILVHQFEVAEKIKDQEQMKVIYEYYIKQFKFINNWDLVDLSAPYIVGKYLLDKKQKRKILYTWGNSKHLWTRRIAIVSNWWFIRQNDLKDIYNISSQLLGDDHDLIHKAVGWMLREAGKSDHQRTYNFIKKNYSKLPRTTLRYAIERYPKSKRKQVLAGKF